MLELWATSLWDGPWLCIAQGEVRWGRELPPVCSLCGIRTQGAPCSPEPSVTTHPVKDVCLGVCQFYRVIGLASHRDGCQVLPREQVWTQ